MSYRPVLQLLLLEHQQDPKFRKVSNIVKATLPIGFIPLLKQELQKIAIMKTMYSQLSKRSMLHLYNDMLAPNFRIYTLEELIMAYITLMKKEQKLLGEDALPLEDFLDVVKRVLKRCKSPEQCLLKLETFYGEACNPTYKVSQIRDSQTLIHVYALDPVNLQREVDSMPKLTLSNWYGDLTTIKQQLTSNTYRVNPDSFDTPELYFEWRNIQISEINGLMKGKAMGGGVIPQDPEMALQDLIKHMFTNDTLYGGFPLVEKCCKYWRIDQNSRNVILHKVANETVLKSDFYSTELSEKIFTICSDVDPLWTKHNKSENDANWDESLNRLMMELRSTLQDIFTFPKFSPLLQIYYSFFQEIPSPRWMKRLKNTLLSTTEKKYVEFLQSVPRDNSLSFNHIEDVSYKIYEMVRTLQKRYPKPLLDQINIPRECALLFIRFFGEDTKNMLKHIEHYALKSPVNNVEAMDCYSQLNQLRDVYSQISKDPFPIELEKRFFQYFDEFTDDIGENFIPVTERAIEADNFQPMDRDAGRMFSQSALDVKKMVNEMWSLVQKYHWKNDIQLAYVYTKLLKHFSQSISTYCFTLISKVEHDLRDPVTVEDKRKSLWIFKNNTQVPQPFNFKTETCVVLNDLSELVHQLVQLEMTINPEQVRRILHDTLENVAQKKGSSVFTIRVIDAENIKSSDANSSTYVSINNTSTKMEIGSTTLSTNTINPRFDQIFELETHEEVKLSFSLWEKSSSQYDKMIGRALVFLNPERFSPNGEPVSMTKDFDIQGSLNLEISLESEKNDAIFYMGKAHRTILRSVDMVISKIVDKFSVFITQCLSRDTLKLCSSADPASAYNALEPLYDYLNANLQTLAMTLTPELLIKVMLQSWNIVLDTLDSLALPPLSASRKLQLNNKWTFTVIDRGIPGYGKVLTLDEIKVIQLWLDSLVEFFHNNGNGPPLTVMHNKHYKKLHQIVEYYDMSATRLKNLVDEWTPACISAIKERNVMLDDPFKRSGTIVAFGSKKRREQSTPKSQSTQLDLEDAVLRILICKDERDFVHSRLKERARVLNSVATERLAKLAMRKQ